MVVCLSADPVAAIPFRQLVREILNSRARGFGRSARKLSDIVKRRSIRAQCAALELCAGRYLQAFLCKMFPAVQTARRYSRRAMHLSAKLDRLAVGSIL
jgi:hypothetical protein